MRTWLQASDRSLTPKLNSTGEYQAGRLVRAVQKTHKTNQDFQFLREAEDLSPVYSHNHRDCEEGVYRLPFKFVVPKCLISPRSDVGIEFLSLLPSVEEGSTYIEPTSRHEFMQPLVSYFLTASLSDIRSRKSHRCSRGISIMPTVLPSPPLQVEHFPHEYYMMCSKTLRKQRWTGALGRLTVSAAEPPCLDISTHSPRATILAPVRLLFTPIRYGTSITPPYEWSLTVKSYLRIMTFTTTKPFTQVPTKDNSSTKSLCNLAVKTTPPEIRECKTLSWRIHRISTIGTIAPDLPLNPWTSTLLIPVNVSKTLLPTFLSPLAARRYALVLQVSIANVCHGRFCLQIPIQITNAPCQLQGTLTINASEQDPEHIINRIGDNITSMELEPAGSGATTDPPQYERGQYVRRA